MQHTNAHNNGEPFLSLSQFDNELQQQAQFVIQQQQTSWQDFSHYAVTYEQTSPVNSSSIPSPVSNDNPIGLKLGYSNSSSPDNTISYHSPPFDSPESIIQQQHSPIFNDPTFGSNNSTPTIQTPSESPRNDLLKDTLDFQYNPQHTIGKSLK